MPRTRRLVTLAATALGAFGIWPSNRPWSFEQAVFGSPAVQRKNDGAGKFLSRGCRLCSADVPPGRGDPIGPTACGPSRLR